MPQPDTRPSESRRRVRLWISGRVQGVCFRMAAQEEAERLGLGGWVRNLPDGRVETEAEGDPGAVDRFVAWCHHGPPHARVDTVQQEHRPATGSTEPFAIVG